MKLIIFSFILMLIDVGYCYIDPKCKVRAEHFVLKEFDVDNMNIVTVDDCHVNDEYWDFNTKFVDHFGGKVECFVRVTYINQSYYRIGRKFYEYETGSDYRCNHWPHENPNIIECDDPSEYFAQREFGVSKANIKNAATDVTKDSQGWTEWQVDIELVDHLAGEMLCFGASVKHKDGKQCYLDLGDVSDWYTCYHYSHSS
jgi:hypothetical protein